jgi:REP element-mobilizing transposase RayT
MPRIRRSEQLGDGFAHVISRGNRRQQLYFVERDYRCYLEFLGEALLRFGVRCHAYCLMPNHVHLLLDGPQESISKAMQRANGRYAQWLNHTYGMRGHVFEGRFWSEAIESEQHLLELARYIVNNPVRAGIVKHASEWPWSSIRATLGEVPAPRFLTTRTLLAEFSRNPDAARTAFATFVAEGVWKPPRPRTPPPPRAPIPVG